VLLVGGAGVGKTSLTKYLDNNNFSVKYNPTLNVEVFPYHSVPFEKECVYNIWEIGGQTQHNGTNSQHYKNIDMAIVMCDNSKISHKLIKVWKREFLNYCPDLPILVVYNKIDLPYKHPIDGTDVCGISIKQNIGIGNLLQQTHDLLHGTNKIFDDI
jgi:small GTP-binding protein